jgi:hypothetical protein
MATSAIWKEWRLAVAFARRASWAWTAAHPHSFRAGRTPSAVKESQIRTQLSSAAQLRLRRASLPHDSDQITARSDALVAELNITRRAELQVISSLERSGFTSLIDDVPSNTQITCRINV